MFRETWPARLPGRCSLKLMSEFLTRGFDFDRPDDGERDELDVRLVLK